MLDGKSTILPLFFACQVSLGMIPFTDNDDSAILQVWVECKGDPRLIRRKVFGVGPSKRRTSSVLQHLATQVFQQKLKNRLKICS